MTRTQKMEYALGETARVFRQYAKLHEAKIIEGAFQSEERRFANFEAQRKASANERMAELMERALEKREGELP